MAVVKTINAAHLQLITAKELAVLLDVSAYTVYAWAASGKGPKCIRLSSGTLRFRIRDIEDWLVEQGEENK